MENPFEIIIERLNAIDNTLEDMSKKYYAMIAKESNKKEIITINEVAEYLYLSVPTVYGLVHKGLIPHYKVRKRLYFKRAEIIEMVDDGKIKTNEEIRQDALDLFTFPRRRKK